MRNLQTGFFLEDGTEIKLGDTLRAASSYPATVLWDEVTGKAVVRFKASDAHASGYADLSDYLSAYADVAVTGNVLFRPLASGGF